MSGSTHVKSSAQLGCDSLVLNESIKAGQSCQAKAAGMMCLANCNFGFDMQWVVSLKVVSNACHDIHGLFCQVCM